MLCQIFEKKVFSSKILLNHARYPRKVTNKQSLLVKLIVRRYFLSLNNFVLVCCNELKISFGK